MKYTEKVQGIVNQAVTAVQNINAKAKELKALYDAERISGEDYKRRNEEMQAEKKKIFLEANQKLQEVSEAYKATALRNSEIDSTMLHEDAKLLQLDMKITPHQFEALAEKHKNNPLMAQLLQEYSNKHDGLYAGFLPTAENKISTFERYISAAHQTIREPDSLRGAMFQEGRYTPQHCTESE